MTELLHWWITLLENKSPAEVAAITIALGVTVMVVVLVAAGVSIARSAPDDESSAPRPPATSVPVSHRRLRRLVEARQRREIDRQLQRPGSNAIGGRG